MNLIKTSICTVIACILFAACNSTPNPDSEWLNYTDLQSGSESQTESREQSVSGTHECIDCSVDDGLAIIDADEITSAKLGFEYIGVIITESRFTDKLKYGDRVETANGVDIAQKDDMERALQECKAGDVVTVTVCRKINGEDVKISVEITLSEKIRDSVNFD